MRKIIRAAAALITFVLAATVCALTAAAAPAVREPLLIGDTDGDGAVTILDATRLQRWLAGFDEITKLSEFLGDVNCSRSTDIIDATVIQRKLADLGDFYAESYRAYYIYDYRFYADYNSGMAKTGTPVVFHADAFGVDWNVLGGANPIRGDVPFTYEFFINGRLVQERSLNNELKYAFTEAGRYDITVDIENALGDTVTAAITGYEVVEPYPMDRAVVVSALFKEDTHNEYGRSPLTVRAEGGSGGYMYMFTLKGRYDGYENDGFFLEEPIDAHSAPILSTGYRDSDTMSIPAAIREAALNGKETEINVYARDSKGFVSEPLTVIYRAGSLSGNTAIE